MEIDALRDDSTLQNYLSALSDIEFNHGQPRTQDSYVSASEHAKKHTRLLDSISLLFSFDDDVFAVAFTRQLSRITIHWAKYSNERVSSTDQAYLDLLFKAFTAKKYQDDSDFILQVCVLKCKTKVMNRIKKAARLFPPVNDTSILSIRDTPYTQRLHQRLVRLRVLDSKVSLGEAVTKFLTNLSAISRETSLDELCLIVKLADHLTPEPQGVESETDLFNGLQLRAVTKIAAFVRVVKQLLTLCSRWGITELVEERVFPPKQRRVMVHAQTVQALNSAQAPIPDANQLSHFSQISDHFPKANAGVGKSPHEQAAVLCSQHCELTLAHHLINLGGKGELEIGCSKASCFWCHAYLVDLNDKLKDSNSKVVLYATHGKRTKGWLLPTEPEFRTVADNVLRYIGQTVADVFARIQAEPRKTSDPRSIEDMELEEKPEKNLLIGPSR
ncbi:hypothetical protein ACLMJK_009509 [Lecanora helva]